MQSERHQDRWIRQGRLRCRQEVPWWRLVLSHSEPDVLEESIRELSRKRPGCGSSAGLGLTKSQEQSLRRRNWAKGPDVLDAGPGSASNLPCDLGQVALPLLSSLLAARAY